MGAKISMEAVSGLPTPDPGVTAPKPGLPGPGGMTGQVFPGIGSIDSVRGEIDDAFADMKTFHNLEPDQVMRMCGGHSARLSEIRVGIQRVEVVARQWKAVREREIEPVLDELRNQFQIASRLHAVREFDWKMATGGGVT